MSKAILVTGAGGFIGHHLSNALAEEGNTVIGVDLHYPSEITSMPERQFKQVVADFRNQDLMKELLRGADFVFHLAAAHLQIDLPQAEYWDVNAHSLHPFLELALECGVQRFVHVSSVGVYGDLQTWPADENTPCRPQSIYGETKLAGEAVVKQFSEETGFPAVIIRPTWVYGPGCPRTLKIYRSLRKGKFVIIGSGENLRHPLYISDVLSAFHLAMECKSAVGETFIIGGEGAITTRQLVEAFCNALKLPKPKARIPLTLGKMAAWGIETLFSLGKKEPPFSRRSLEFFHTNNCFNISKAKKVLGFNPAIAFEEGLRQTRPWLASHA